MKKKLLFTVIITTALLISCSITNHVREKSHFSILGGYNKGGITENTDLKVVPNLGPDNVDAFTGATSAGFHTGVHINIPLGKNELETGLDYMYNKQTFTYLDNENLFTGERKLSVSQFMVPLTYNIILFRNWFPSSEFQLRLGYVSQFNMVNVSNTGTLPQYSVRRYSGGGTLGIAAYPVRFNNGSKLGFYIDGYRGTRIFEDFYNQKDFEMPGSSYMRFGIRYKFH